MGSDVIKSRSDFFRILGVTQKAVGDLLRKVPKSETYEMLELQLDAMWRWTAGDRTPTEEERNSIDIGLLAVRELEPANDDEEQELITNLHELNYYFEYWPDDPDSPAETPEL